MSQTIAEAKTTNSEFRYERKFVPNSVTRQQVEKSLRLHPSAFREIYQPRFVNNIYFDSPSLKNYRASVDGIAERIKVRIRWYGDLFGEVREPKLEIKEKVGQLGTKHHVPLGAFGVRVGMTSDEMIECLDGSNVPHDFSEQILSMRPVILNRYTRKYWMSRDGRFRATLDWGVEYFSVSGKRFNLSHPRQDDGKLILELKYPREFDSHAERVSRDFPCRLGKSSKYVAGINLLYGFLSVVNAD